MMIRNSLLLFFLTFSFLGNAQTERGSILLGGSSNLNSSLMATDQMDDLRGVIGFNLAPIVGVFVANNFVIGSEFDLNFSAYVSEDYTYSERSLAVVPFARYYFGSENIKPYIHTGIGGGVTKFETEVENEDLIALGVGTSTNIMKMLVFGLGGGVSFFFTESIAMDLGLGISTTSYKFDDDYLDKYRETDLAVNVGFSFFL